MTIRAGVIGAGYLGQHHARIYASLEDVDLVGVADIDAGRAEEVAARYGCPGFVRYAELLDRCDALSIVTPTPAHYAVAMDCLAAGRDILIEKPITVTIDEAMSVVEEAAKRGRILQVGHLERYNPGIVAATAMLESPRFIEAERLAPFQPRGTDVDVTLDLMIHDVDIVISIARSRITDIRAVGECVMTKKIDVAKAWIEFENGCKALITASRLSPEKRRRINIFQKESYIAVDLQSQEVRRCSMKGTEMTCEVVRPENREPLRDELRDFLNCVRDRQRPKVSGEEGMQALEVAVRISEMLKE